MVNGEVTVRGIGVSRYSIVITSLISTSVYLWLVAQLIPAELGIVTKGYSIYLMLYLFKDFGLTTAIVSQKEITSEFMVNAYTLRVCVITVLAVVGLAIFLVLPELMGISDLRWIALFVVFSLFAESVGFLSAAMLQRDLAFSALARVDVMTSIVGGGTAVAVALCGYPVLALFVGLAVSSVMRSVVLIRLRPVRTRVSYRLLRTHGLLTFGSELFVIRGASFTVLNLNVFVLASMDIGGLGFYGLAAQWATKPSDMSSAVINRVMLPTYSAVVRLGKDVFDSYLVTTKYLSMMAFGVLCVFIGFGPLFVDSIYGSEWEASIPVIEVLLLFWLFRTLAEPAGSLLVSVQRPSIYIWVQILGLAVMAVLGYPVADNYGAPGCSVLLSSAFFVHVCVLWFLVSRSFNEEGFSILVEILRPVASALIAALTGMMTYLLLPGDWVFFVMTVQIPSIYIPALYILARDDLLSVLSFVRRAALAGRWKGKTRSHL